MTDDREYPIDLYQLARTGPNTLLPLGAEIANPAAAAWWLRRVVEGEDAIVVTRAHIPPLVLAAGLHELARHLESGHITPPRRAEGPHRPAGESYIIPTT